MRRPRGDASHRTSHEGLPSLDLEMARYLDQKRWTDFGLARGKSKGYLRVIPVARGAEPRRRVTFVGPRGAEPRRRVTFVGPRHLVRLVEV